MTGYQKLRLENERLKDYLYATILEAKQGDVTQARAWYFYTLQRIKEGKDPYEAD